ncbi:MAG: hypothetical protein LBR35_01740 [Rickettsiales bacterium]|jgi:hypothetical protein|nr:hypothetical protein [Rickettsiales bacterium]
MEKENFVAEVIRVKDPASQGARLDCKPYFDLVVRDFVSAEYIHMDIKKDLLKIGQKIKKGDYVSFEDGVYTVSEPV